MLPAAPDPGPGTGPGISDADFAEFIHAAGVAPDSALALAQSRHQMSPADLAEHLHANGMAPDSALKYAQVGGAPQPPAQGFNLNAIPRQAANDVLSTLPGIVGIPRTLAGALRNAQDMNTAAGAPNALRPGATDRGALYNALNGIANSVVPVRASLQSTADNMAAPASDAELGLANHPTAAALARLGIGAATSYGTGKLLGVGTGALGTRARAAITDATVPAETDAAYQAVRAGPAVTDPAVLREANKLAQTPEGLADYQKGKQILDDEGRSIPDLPQPTTANQKSLLQAQLQGAPPPPATSITSLTPDQIDAWKRGANARGRTGAFQPLLDAADPVMSGYKGARGLAEVNINLKNGQHTPNLQDAAVPAARLATLAAGVGTRNPMLTSAGLLSFLAKSAPEMKLSKNAAAALQGVQQQVGDMSLSQLFQQGGALPAALTGLDRASPYIPAVAMASAAAPGSGATP